MRPGLTVITPTFNEENHIEQALTCSRFADEILVIDSYSTDRTVEIVQKSEARLLQREFDNFSNQKNFAISRARYDWILILDADEYITHKLQKEILKLLSSKSQKIAYTARFRNYFINRFLHYGSNGNTRKLCLFNRNFCHYEGLVHERLICDGATGALKYPILHYTYKNLFHFFQKKSHYSTLQSEQILNKNKSVRLFHIIVKPLFRFFSEYLLRLGFLDGIAGLTSTTMNGFGVLSRYVKAGNSRNKWKLPELQDYKEYTTRLIREARIRGLSRKKTAPIYFTDFYLAPLGAFLKSYFIQMNFTKGLEGYVISYLEAFRKYNTILYHWLNKRNLE